LRIVLILDRPFIPLPRFIRSRRPTPLLTPSLVLFPPSFFLRVLSKRHMFGVYFRSLSGFLLFIVLS
jgi:hypothetical protein